MSLKIVCLNIEIDRHLDRVLPFLEREEPDVVLLQEVLKKDLPLFEQTLNMKSIFTPVAQFQWRGAHQVEGITILTHLPIIKQYVEYYKGNGDPVPMVELGPETGNKLDRALKVVHIENKDKTYCLATTHFTWTPDGQTSEEQTQDLDILLNLLSAFPDVVLCGDFNAPRGNSIFSELASRFKDNIPPHITTTIDKKWHRAGDLQLVVDGLFSTPHYKISEVKLVDDVSDHIAIVAKVEKVDEKPRP